MNTSEAGGGGGHPHTRGRHHTRGRPGTAARRRRRWHTVLVVILVVLVAAVVILSRWNVGYYALTPGDATPVASFITVPANLDHPLSGSILLTDVYETQLNALTYLQERYFS